MDYFDLSNAQKMILFSSILNPNNSAFYLNFKKKYSVSELENLKKAVNAICSSYLNLQIKELEDDYKQYYAEDNNEDKFEFVDLTKTNGDVDDFVNEFLDNSFEDLFDNPLYKIGIIKTNDSILLLGTFHHILLDGTSLFSLFPREINKCIETLKNNKEYEKISDLTYETYVEREKEYLKSQEYNKDKEYWLNNLKEYKQDWYSFDNLELGTYELKINETLTKDLMKLGNVKDTRISPFILALSVISLYFAKSKSLKDIVWNTSISGRYFGEDISQLLGMFTNTIPLKIDYKPDLSFEDLLLNTKSVLKEGLTHGKIQFSEYSAELRNNNIDPGLITMYSVVSNSTDYDTEFLSLQKDTEFPFHIRVNKNYSDKKGLQSLFFEYNKNCFSNKQIKEIAEGIETLLADISKDSTKKCEDYEIEINEFFKAETYFKKILNSFDSPTIISPDVYDKNTKSSFNIKKLTFNEEKLNKIKAYSKENKINIKEFLYAIILFNLTKFSFSKDILISCNYLRNQEDNQYLNKFNELALSYKFDTNIPIKEYLKGIKEKIKETSKYYFYPLKNNKTLNFESEILLNYFDSKNTNLEYFNDLNNEINIHDFKIVFSFINKEDLSLIINYDSSNYSDEIINSFIESTNILIDKFIENTETPLKNISITESKNEQFEIKLKNEGLINKIFENIAQDNPEKTILYAEDGELTYSQLNKKANKIANALIDKGVKVEDKIMFMMKRNSDLIATVLGIVKAGATFIPIDPNYPENRIKQILEDSNSKFIITSENIEYNGENRLNVNELLEFQIDTNPNITLTPDNLCFIIYTSGSTGKPKGVMIKHMGISNYIANHPLNIPIYALNKNCNKMISISTVSFIVFLREIFGTILNGLPIVFANEEQAINPLKLAELFKKTKADAFGSTPTRLLEYIKFKEIQDALNKCKFIIVGGEGFPPRLYDQLRKYTGAEIYNSYGPTEVTIASHGKLIESNIISAGFPMLNVIDKVMDIDGNELPPYVTGEIYVGGAGIARGYYNNPKLTKKTFMEINNTPFYNTGDLGKKDKTGELYVLGRNDTQIKLRGLRIELSEIEGSIINYENIDSAVVIVKEINDIEYLCAYYTKENNTKTINKEDLRNYLTKQLPDYMVPHYIEELEKFPTTPNGKTDFKNLPDPKIDVEKFIEPSTKTEKELFKIVSDMLNITEFGINTDLFNIGLTSLTVVQLVSAIQEKFNTQIMITEVLKYKTIQNISKHITETENEELTTQELYPLTQNQLGVYFECVKNPNLVSYNLPKKIDFNGDIDANKLKLAIITAINNHPYLKTRIIMENGEVYQERRDNLKIDDLIEITDSNMDFNDFVKPFKLDEGPLFRFKIINNSILLADFHHIIVDGTSLNILFEEIAKIYDGLEYELEEIDGFKYAQQESKIENSSLYKEAELFFFNKIKEFDEATVISPDLIEDGDEVAANKSIFVDKTGIDKICDEKSISQNNLFLATTSFVLSKFVYNKDLLIATISNGRFNPNQQKTLAMMVKTLPLVLKLNSNLSIKEFFQYINDEWFKVLSYSSYPFTKISNEYDITPDFLYAYHGKIIQDIEINGKRVQRESLDFNDLKFKTAIDIIDVGDQYKISCNYNNKLYSKQLINTLLNSISIVLNKFTTYDENTKLEDISIIEKDKIDENSLEFEEIEEYRINKVFEKQVELHKNELAVSAEDGDLTFEELNIKANKIANSLIKKGVTTEDKVMLVLKRNSNVFASIFGILKSGAAFIPVDSDYPKDRIVHVLTDSDSKFIIIDDVVEEKCIDLTDYQDDVIHIEELFKETDISNPNPDIKPNSLAYLIYTSGSTGLPKGVMLEHKNLTNFAYPNPKNVFTYEIATNTEANYKVLSLATVAFDFFLHEIMSPLLNGLPVVFANDIEYKNPLSLYELIKRTKPNVYMGTPSRLLQYLEVDGLKEEFYNFKAFGVGGEAFATQLLELLSKNSKGKIYNVYGPTETTITCNARLIEDGNLYVGKPLFNVHEEIMDLDSNPLPPNVIGELYIAGYGVSRAYLNRPENNAKAYKEINGIRFYKSGDYAKFLEDGDVEILGRLDNQIKLRGLRIEIGEIESAISNFKPINSVAVVVRKIKGNDHLCAYFTVDEEYQKKNRENNEYSFDINELKQTLSEKLTYYMVPTVYMELDEMPQTLNGKTDLKNLPEPVLITEYVAPENDIEAFFTNTFAEILNLDKVSVTDNFFEIGGTSLLVTKITIAALNRNYQISYGDIFNNPTPKLLAEFVSNKHSTESQSENKYDYTDINNLLKKNTLESFLNGEIEENLGDILLTGATGFLGIHVLKEIIDTEDGNIYCFVRSRGTLTGKDRLKSLLFYYFDEDYDEIFDKRLHIIEGDITNFEDFEKLISYNIDTIINCAANVKHFSAGTDIEDINLGGVINGLKFAKMKNSKYVQVSTYSVAGESVDNFPPVDVNFTEKDLFTGQTLENQYINSKFLAERAVLEAAAKDDLNVKIMRVGNLMARSSDSEFQINFESNGFINRLKAFVTIGKMPYAKLSESVEFSPIDITAKSILALSKTPKECLVFHPYNYHRILFGDILNIIEDLDLNIKPSEEDEYQEALNEAFKDKSKQEGVRGLITSVGEGYIKRVWVPVENNYTAQILYRLGVAWPLISEEYIYMFVKYLKDLNFFN